MFREINVLVLVVVLVVLVVANSADAVVFNILITNHFPTTVADII